MPHFWKKDNSGFSFLESYCEDHFCLYQVLTPCCDGFRKDPWTDSSSTDRNLTLTFSIICSSCCINTIIAFAWSFAYSGCFLCVYFIKRWEVPLSLLKQLSQAESRPGLFSEPKAVVSGSGVVWQFLPWQTKFRRCQSSRSSSRFRLALSEVFNSSVVPGQVFVLPGFKPDCVHYLFHEQKPTWERSNFLFFLKGSAHFKFLYSDGKKKCRTVAVEKLCRENMSYYLIHF